MAFALGRPLIAAANDELFGSPGWKGGDGKTTTEQKDKMDDGEGDEDIDLQNWHFESEEINKTVKMEAIRAKKSQHGCVRWALREHLTPPCYDFACGGLEDCPLEINY